MVGVEAHPTVVIVNAVDVLLVLGDTHHGEVAGEAFSGRLHEGRIGLDVDVIELFQCVL